jgi:PIN domain nuclease of toxin-antitoxin system
MPAVLDTHAAVWYLLDSKELPPTVFGMIDDAAARGTPTYISAISLVEIVYLVERGRIAPHAFDVFARELSQSNPAFALAPLDFHVANALRGIPRNLVPDMPDRIIAATALHLGLPLVTRGPPPPRCRNPNNLVRFGCIHQPVALSPAGPV